jgi:glycosyltransferase involved in cell wall biosynthesis
MVTIQSSNPPAASSPKVSVIVTAYNSAATIDRAIESARAQTMDDLEIVVVDDASTDDTVAVVEAIRDERIRLVRNARNRGIGGAKNVGVENARGRYIAFLDSDDEWVTDKLATQLAALDASPSRAPLAFSAFWVHRTDFKTVVLRCPSRYETWLKSILLGETFSLGSTLLATRECFERVGPFNEGLARLQDRDWTLRYLQRWDEFVFVPEPLAHIYNSGWPRPETIARAVAALYGVHEQSLRARDPALARLFRASLRFEVAAIEYRNGRVAAAGWHMMDAICRNPFFGAYLAHRVIRKFREGDLN